LQLFLPRPQPCPRREEGNRSERQKDFHTLNGLDVYSRLLLSRKLHNSRDIG
jgi:hypothetical protein